MQRLALFAATAENKWVSTFEPHHAMASLGLFDQQGVDLLLRHRMLRRFFANVNRPGRRGVSQQQRIGKIIVNHHIRLAAAAPPRAP